MSQDTLLICIPFILILALIKTNKIDKIGKLTPYFKFLNSIALSLSIGLISKDILELVTILTTF